MNSKKAIPDFKNGFLPPGCYETSCKEIKKIFVDDFSNSNTRKSRWKCFELFYDDFCENVKSCNKILIDGSFISNKINPFDVDFVIVLDSLKIIQSEFDYINKINEEKSILRQSYDFLKEKYNAGLCSQSELYNHEFFNYGCDFFFLTKKYSDDKNYLNYIKRKNYWLNQWGHARNGIPKGFLNIKINQGD